MHFKLTETQTKEPLDLVHTDLWGPSSMPSSKGCKYYMSFIDDYSRFTWIYFLSAKSQALDVFKEFKLKVENQLNRKIKAL